ncbi:glycosyltransferase [Sphingomonas sp. GV3]|jgi:glycosyltransferase involved in cell wall biosynthesis|uniref:glycosyltransferase n=1 Tax=Sphingomonas sp. GV3 TaxID=3040671 RepID=UPI00280A4FCC|nr:glycosyltransferase [Sphingomonas sp. GV3]
MNSNDTAMPPLSVVMTTYNGAAYLAEQLGSILPQLDEADELVVSDDGSTDTTQALLRAAAQEDPRIRIVASPGGLGPIRNFEHALGHARGAVLVLSDQDDKWLPGRLDRVRHHFDRATTSFDLLVLDSIIADGSLTPTEGSLFAYLDVGTGQVKNIVRNTYVGCHMAFRRELLSVALPFPQAISMHDVWLGLVSELVGPVTFAPGATMLFRRGGHNYTQARYSLMRRLTWRVGLVRSLLELRLSKRFRRARAAAGMAA